MDVPKCVNVCWISKSAGGWRSLCFVRFSFRRPPTKPFSPPFLPSPLPLALSRVRNATLALAHMSLKAEIKTWADALAAYDEQNYEAALSHFQVRSFSFNVTGLRIFDSLPIKVYSRLVQDNDQYWSHPRRDRGARICGECLRRCLQPSAEFAETF